MITSTLVNQVLLELLKPNFKPESRPNAEVHWVPVGLFNKEVKIDVK